MDFQKYSDGKAVKSSRKHNVWSLISGKNFITFIMFGLVLILWPFWSAETVLNSLYLYWEFNFLGWQDLILSVVSNHLE